MSIISVYNDDFSGYIEYEKSENSEDESSENSESSESSEYSEKNVIKWEFDSFHSCCEQFWSEEVGNLDDLKGCEFIDFDMKKCLSDKDDERGYCVIIRTTGGNFKHKFFCLNLIHDEPIEKGSTMWATFGLGLLTLVMFSNASCLP